MSAPRHLVGLDALSSYDALIDARSPAEYEEDHLPGAINCPVLDNAERAEVGTLYVQVSPFEARKVGAALVFRNIARHVETLLRDKPRDWRPLVYCWRGGQRSGAFTWALRQIGWDAGQLVGGYKTFRTAVVAAIASLPAALRLHVVAGPTGSGKTLLLRALAEEGAQVLDLEALARHRGSVLGGLPGVAQPSQKWFETALYETLRGLDPARPVFVEAESRKIGRIQLPNALIDRMRAAPCSFIDAPLQARLDYLLQDYAHFASDPADLVAKLDAFRELHSRETMERWHMLAASRDLATLFEELVRLHYDPLYARSQRSNFKTLGDTPSIAIPRLDATALREAARSLIARA